ncbi:tetratricopeptide repeat [Fusarium beomiforme]|uniref:Tetratricopeptide repeat n=1 Tax=Fusarium beomiforme TaxID=44412 RepID=A0A9P5AJF6_9HYPO|nr:tetratricopeptide repeat [Fusarium beomiforme]
MRASGNEVGALRPEEYYEHASMFSNAIRKGAHPMRVNLSENNIPVGVAHEMACLLWLQRRTKAHSTFSMAMWASASELNYDPATVSIVSQLMSGGSWRKITAFAEVENRFMRLVAEAKNCNALTVYGEYLFQDGKYDQAVAILKQAIGVEDSAFEWKRKCLTCLAKSYAKLGKAEMAKKTLEVQEDSEADAELDQLLQLSDAGVARQLLYQDAIKGRHELYRQLAEVEFERESKEIDAELKKIHHLWGLEWSRLADPDVKF